MRGNVEDEIKDGKRVLALSNYLLRDLKCRKRNSFFLSEVIRKCDDLLSSEIVLIIYQDSLPDDSADHALLGYMSILSGKVSKDSVKSNDIVWLFLPLHK